MRLRNLSVFQRLLYAILATALLVALVSGGVHYGFAVKLIESSLRTQLDNVMATTEVFMERAYQVPLGSDLRLLETSPVVNALLISRGAERHLDRLPAERMFQSVVRANPRLYQSITLLDADGRALLAVHRGRRMRADSMPVTEAEAALFETLEAAGPGQVRYHGPLRHADGQLSMLAGIAKSDPDIARFGGAIIAEVPLTGFVRSIEELRVFEHPVAWLLGAGGEVLRSPAGGGSQLDPRPFLEPGADPPSSGLVLASRPGVAGSPFSLMRVALSVPGDVYSSRLHEAGTTALAVLAMVALLSWVVALVVARQVTRPVRALSDLVDAVGRGDLSRRIPVCGGGELGRLGGAFNRMLDALNVSTVSRTYVDQIIESMSDALVVLGRDGAIETMNRAALDLFGGAREARTLDELLPDPAARETLTAALAAERPVWDLQTIAQRSGGERVQVWLTSAPMRDRTGRCIGTVLAARDVSEQLRAQRDLQAAHQTLSFHVHNSPLAVIEWDPAFRITGWSGRAQELFGWRAEEVLGLTADDFRFIYPADLEAARDVGRRLRAGEPRNVSRNRNYRKDGTVVHCEWHNSLMVDEQGRPVSVLSLVQDVTESAVLSQELEHQASHDALTGLLNRRAFDRRLDQVVARRAGDGEPAALCFVDMDQFKVVNDSCGHLAGDELLRQVAALLQGAVRRSDTVARLGGDEFAVLMESCPAEDAERTARHLLAALRDHPFIWDEKIFRVGASVGLVPIAGDDVDAAGLLSAADAACLAAKEQGRDRVHVFRDHHDLQRHRGEAEWVSRLHRALDEGRFVLMAQPIAPTVGGGARIERHEILLRMLGDDDELVAPGAFLAPAERYRLMPRLDRWVIRSTIDLLAQAPPLDGAERMLFVNISGQTLADDGLEDFVARHLAERGVAPRSLCFEITETAAVLNVTRARAIIERLTALGCHFALDDFGAGVSSFAYLKNLPVHFLKIDGMFVRDIVEDPANLALVRSINEVGHAMGKRTIAEFVESESVLAHLRAIGVDHVQGFHIGRPQPALSVLGSVAPVRLVSAARA